ncbi:MAG TPA: RNA polymerase sigma factor [Burkholderiales bacterium]|nr:RNA polymerase sigma factor [Burkholderiales bacterium]
MPTILPFPRARRAAPRFEALLRPHLEYLHRLAWRFTGNSADAEDLVQDVLLKLYPLTAELAAIEAPRPWLARVLYREYIDLVRRRARRPMEQTAGTQGEDPLDAVPATADGPEQLAERAQWQERLQSALERLNPGQRAVLTMHDIEGYSLEELEGVLETPLGTLKSRLHRARARLRELLPMELFPDRKRVNG